MAEPKQRALGKDVMFLLVPITIAMLVLSALAFESAHAEHGGPHVKWVATDNPEQDLSVEPLVIMNGAEFSIDLVVELPSTSDSIFAFASDFNLSFEPRVVWLRGDAERETPGFQINISDADLALGNKERLITTVVGFAGDGDAPRGCNFDPTPPAGDDSVYTFIKGGTDGTDIQLQLLNQHARAEWGEGWCGPTAAGISLGWFAETAAGANPDHANLIPDINNNSQIDTGDKLEAINTLGEFMQTSSTDGTTDSNLIAGLESYISSSGLTGDFVITVFNHPNVSNFFNELEAGEDVLVRITSGDGTSHWLVGRSFTRLRDDKGTPEDVLDDTFAVSFVDPGTASVYHTQILFGRRILYNGVLVDFDLMISVSPTDVPTNEETAEYFVIRNEVFGEPPDYPTLTGDFSFALLGDPNNANSRTPQLTGDANGRVVLARLSLVARGIGEAEINFFNSFGPGFPAVQIVHIDSNGDSVLLPVEFGSPAAHFQVNENLLEVKVKLQGPERLDPIGFSMPLDVFLFERGEGNTDADVLNANPVDEFRCERMFTGAADDGTPRGMCNVPASVIGTFDVAVKSDRTLLHVARSVAVPGSVDFDGPAHDTSDLDGLHEGDINEDGFIGFSDFTLWLDTVFTTTCSDDPNDPDFPTHPDDFSAGDFDKDCFSGILDFTIFLDNFNEESPQDN